MSSNVVSLHARRNNVADCQDELYRTTSEAEAESRRLALIKGCQERIAADAQLMMLAGSKDLVISYLSKLYDHFQGGRK